MTIIDNDIFSRTLADPEFQEVGITGAIFGLNLKNSVLNVDKASFQTVAGIINAKNHSNSVLLNTSGTIFTQASNNTYIFNDNTDPTVIENTSINNSITNFDNFSGDLSGNNYVVKSEFTGIGFKPINNELSSKMTSLLGNDRQQIYFYRII